MSLQKMSTAFALSVLLSSAAIPSAHALPATPAQIQACKVTVMNQTVAKNQQNYARNYNVNMPRYRFNSYMIAKELHSGLKVCEIDWGKITGR